MAMGDVIARLSVFLGMDTAAFEKGATISEKRLSQMEKKFSKLGDKIAGFGKTLTVGLTLPLTAFGVSAIDAASDAAELQSAFDQTFGQMSDTMNKWAEDTGNALGRSTQEMQKAANTFGIFFNTAVDPQKAAEMSQTFAQLAQDLGSFYNTDTETAIGKLRSGLSGESEPLRDFGVFLTEANVKAKALELGLTGVGNELTEQEKIVARYQLILEATTNAQGDVERTSAGTANQIRAAKAAFEELQVVIGTKLLPIITPLIEKLGAVLTWFTDLPEPIQNVALVVTGLTAALGPFLLVLGNLLPLLIKLGPAISFVGKALLFIAANLAILAFAAVIAGIYLAWKNWDKIEEIVRNTYNGVKRWLQDKLGAVFDWVYDKLVAVGGWFYDLYDKVVGHSYIPDMVDEIGVQMRRLDTEMVDPANQATSKTAQAFRDLQQRLGIIFDDLFPEARARTDFEARLATIDEALEKKQISIEQHAALIEAAQRKYLGLARDFLGVADGEAPNDQVTVTSGQPTLEELGKSLTDKLPEALGKFGDSAEAMRVRVVESFEQMAQSALSSLSQLINGIKGGSFLDILSGIVGVVGEGAKLFGLAGARATGGPVGSGKPYLVGERGPELFIPNFSGQIVPNHQLGRSVYAGMGGNRQTPTTRVEIVDTTGLFRYRVDGQIAEAAPAIAAAGAQGGAARMVYSQSRRWR